MPPSSSASCGSRCLRPRAACSTSAARPGSSPAPSGTHSEPTRPYSIPAPDELAHAAAAGMETFAGFAEDADLGARTFDLVLLCQTIDHLLDIAATLHSIRSWVAPGVAPSWTSSTSSSCCSAAARSKARQDRPPVFPHAETALAYFRADGAVADRGAALGRRSSRLPARAGRARRARLGRADVAAQRVSQAPGWRLRAARMRAVAVVPARGGSGGSPVRTSPTLERRRLVRRALKTALAAGCFEASRSPPTTTRSLAEAEGLRTLVVPTARRSSRRRPRGPSTSSSMRSPARAATTLRRRRGRPGDVTVHLARRSRGSRAMLASDGRGLGGLRRRVEAGLHPLKLKLLEGGRLVPYLEDDALAPSQLLPQLWTRNGSVYVSRRDVLDAGSPARREGRPGVRDAGRALARHRHTPRPRLRAIPARAGSWGELAAKAANEPAQPVRRRAGRGSGQPAA